MDTDYKVGKLIYDANIYDGLNTFLSDLQFYKKWLPTNKDAQILELCCGTGRLTLPEHLTCKKNSTLSLFHLTQSTIYTETKTCLKR